MTHLGAKIELYPKSGMMSFIQKCNAVDRISFFIAQH